MTTQRTLLLLSLLALVGCGGSDAFVGIDPVTGEGVDVAEQLLVVDDLYAKLREAEGLLPQPPPQTVVQVGTLDAASGSFTGLTSTWGRNPVTGKPYLYPAVTSIAGIDAVLEFRIVNGSGATLTINGQTATTWDSTVSLNVGRARSVTWTLSSSGRTVTDTLNISRPSAFGAGAFTISALPISIVYEPPMNAARTNSATIAFRQEMTTITTLSSGQGSTASPKWATGIVLASILDRLAKKSTIAAGVKAAFTAGKTLLGSVETSATTGTTVNTDSTLGVSQVSASSITTNARLGPGHGDLVVFYKNARVAWAMEEGEVSLTLIDHGPLAMVTIDTLKNDLAAVRAGSPAPVTGLDAVALEALIGMNPQATTSTRSIDLGQSSASLPTPRFKKDTTLLLNGTTFNNSLSHTITQTDKTTTTTTSTTVKNYHPGWLSLIGVGVTKAGVFTTSMSMSSSRTDSVSSTVTASFNLSASSTESYSVEVYYDNVFGTFLTRKPSTSVIGSSLSP